MRKRWLVVACGALVLVAAGASAYAAAGRDAHDCVTMLRRGLRHVADRRDQRFLGKVHAFVANCRGGEAAERYRDTPWVDWGNYWATGDEQSRSPAGFGLGRLSPDSRGLDGALLDLEYQRIELIKFNVFDNYTFQAYVRGQAGVPGRSLRVWPEMRLPSGHPEYAAVGGAAPEQLCRGELIRWRTLSGICNDIRNPAMGSAGMDFARNVEFESTYPELGTNRLARNRHGDRIGLLKPDPQVISRELLTRAQSDPARCRGGQGVPGDSMAGCDYIKAPFFNVLAAFWIQWMTHDWFSHLEEGHNGPELMSMGCQARAEQGAQRSLTPDEVAALGCRPDDRIDRSFVDHADPAPTFRDGAGAERLARAPRTTKNNVTAWWDASQIYGYDSTSVRRVRRDPADPAKLLMLRLPGRGSAGDRFGYLPLLRAGDPMNPMWAGQESVAFPDNWSVGLSFLHNLFVREHNIFVDDFRAQAARTPDADSGLRDPARPEHVIRYRDVTPEELYQVARLVVAAEIAKIHTTEWTTQLLYDEVLYQAMNANWHGLLHDKPLLTHALQSIAVDKLARSRNEEEHTQWYSVFASGTGVFGIGSHHWQEAPFPLDLVSKARDVWDIRNPDDVNGGVNHFGSPFNFPEEFITVYRLHALVPDMIEYRELGRPNQVRRVVPMAQVLRGDATRAMEDNGLSNWALSFGRQRLGALTLQNYPQILQNLPMPRIDSKTKTIDIAALDLIRDRERGVPRFNEFRRQYGLHTLSGFDDFIDHHLAAGSPERKRQEALVRKLREVYGQHRCDASKVITDAQLNDDGSPINDCLGHPNGSMVDNVEDLDVVVGFLAESTRPHGFAISETQFTVFIINASRRLFSDRFFTSSFRPEFYTTFGVNWVNDNGPDGKVMEKGQPNGHTEEVSPMKRVLLRAMPEL
ncbi:MAG TPA: peroxidase family protein, partial [Longimicrobiales bacterium]